MIQMSESEKNMEEAYRGLNRETFLVLLIVVLLLFMFLNPIHQNQSTEAWDENILWSYFPIPVLVLIALYREKNLSWLTFGLETMQLVLVKFGITFLLSHTIWFLDGPPKSENIFIPEQSAFAPEPLPYALSDIPEPSIVPKQALWSFKGQVKDRSGRAVQGALVYIAKGLDEFTFTPPKEPLHIKHDGKGFFPSFNILQAFQELEVRSVDGKLHTARLTLPGGRRLFNVPVLPRQPQRLMFNKTYGVTYLRSETDVGAQPAILAIVAHPFVSVTGTHGDFSWTDIPKRTVEVLIWHAKLGHMSSRISPDKTQASVVRDLHFDLTLDQSDQ
ncbi:MAG: hypothetical protein CMH60_04425 [Myxococcales bacterium]|nr:hypothetical protein [Myxococcales bacterium]